MILDIREFELNDILKIEKLIGKTIDISFLGYYSKEAREFLKKRVHSARHIKRHAKEGFTCILEDVDKSLIGTGTLINDIITRVYIYPGYQNRGYGKSVMQYLERMAFRNEIRTISLHAMLPALSFYVSLGYVIVEDTSYTINNEIKVFVFKMKKEL